MKETIKNRLKELNWSVTRLHEGCGVRYATLTEFINGNKQISFDNLEKICNCLNLELRDI